MFPSTRKHLGLPVSNLTGDINGLGYGTVYGPVQTIVQFRRRETIVCETTETNKVKTETE